jgi:PAS domain S-box-containing protein
METVEQHNHTLGHEAFHRLVDNVAEVLYSLSFIDMVRMNFVNSKVEELTGYAVEEILIGNCSWIDLIHVADRQRLLEAFEQCKSNAGAYEIEYRLVNRDGSVREVLDRAKPVFNNQGEVIGVDGLIVDVTEQNRLQHELDRTQMIQNIGRLAAGIAHEINTPIQFIGDNMRFLSDSFNQVIDLLGMYRQLALSMAENDMADETKHAAIAKARSAENEADLDFLTEEIPRAIEQTLDGIKRVLTIVAAMRDFSHIDERRMAPADLNKAIRSTLTILRNEIKYVADVKTDLDENLPRVYCCVDEINQALLNLLINAAQSIADVVGGDGRARGLITVTSRQYDKNVLITITDTGTGIKPEIRDKIFDPFFTDKQSGKGTGQGLSLARSIVVQKHGGSLEFETEVGAGTTFTVCLPVEQNPAKRNG